MQTRINIAQTEPAAFKAMYALENYLTSGSLSATHKELIKIRSSQINGCAYCLDMHCTDALKNGETPQRIFVLSAWRETELFTEEEKAILALTEEITGIHQNGLTEETYRKAAGFFDANYLSQLIIAIVTINAWNRIAISTHLQIGQ